MAAEIEVGGSAVRCFGPGDEGGKTLASFREEMSAVDVVVRILQIHLKDISILDGRLGEEGGGGGMNDGLASTADLDSKLKRAEDRDCLGGKKKGETF